MIQNEAMVVILSVSQWTARKYDKGVSLKVANDYAVKDTVGRYNKALIAKEAIQKITKAVSAARVYHYQNTLPWDDGGGRLLPSKAFKDYSKAMREYRVTYEQAVREFVVNYETYRDDAEVTLGAMFNPGDYPGRHEIEGKFGFSVDVEPVPSSADFRVSLQESEVSQIKKDIDGRVNARVAEATRDLYIRLNDALGKFAEKLSDKDSIFRDTLVGNIQELLALLPKLNVTNDKKLTALCLETKKKIMGIEPDTLRNDASVRSKAADDAKAILDKMSGYLSK